MRQTPPGLKEEPAAAVGLGTAAGRAGHAIPPTPDLRRPFRLAILEAMNATPLLGRIADALREQRLEAVLIGNAAAAIHGAPVTTLDFDFMFRSTPQNLRKLKAVARSLDAMILRPYYPVSQLYRVVDDAGGLQADFMPAIHGVQSFEGLRSRSVAREIAGRTILVASLDDIIASKKAAGRDRDLAVLPVLEQTRKAAAQTRPRT
jgi:hypothetical protein